MIKTLKSKTLNLSKFSLPKKLQEIISLILIGIGLIWFLTIISLSSLATILQNLKLPIPFRSTAYAIITVILGLHMNPKYSILVKKESNIWLLTFISSIYFFSTKEIQLLTYSYNALDFGYFSSVIYNYASDGSFISSIFGASAWQEHCSPILYFLAFFAKYISPSQVLIFFQSISFTAGVFLLMKLNNKSNSFPIIHFAFIILNPFLNEIHRFDFHPETLAIPFAILLIWLVEKGLKNIWSLLTLIASAFILVMTKENASIFLIGLSIFSMFSKRWKESILIFLIALIGLLIFYKTTFQYPQYVGFQRYNLHSSSFSPPFLLNSFLRIFRISNIKTLLLLVSSTSLSLILYPKYIIIPILNILANLSSPSYLQSKLKFQYSTFIIPTMLYTMVKRKKFGFIQVFLVAISIWTLFPKYINSGPINHWKALKEAIEIIPNSSSVSVTSNIYPYIFSKANTKWIQSTQIPNSRYIIIDTKYGYSPLNEKEIYILDNNCKNNLTLIYDKSGVKVYTSNYKKRKL